MKKIIVPAMSKNVGIRNPRYIERGDAGEKRCSKCLVHKPLNAFKVDKSRFDGRGYICADCRYCGKGPSRKDRIYMKSLGQSWCSGCEVWMASDKVRGGSCRKCTNAKDRARYASSEKYRETRLKRTAARKRDVDPVPVFARIELLDQTNGLCSYCPAPATTWDHFVPVTKGGQTSPGNMLPCCGSCNSSKNNRDGFEWLAETGRELSPEAGNILCHAYSTISLSDTPFPL